MLRRNRGRSEQEVSLSRMIDLLFEYGQDVTGKRVTYQSVAEATGLSWSSIRNLRVSEDANPNYRTLRAIADFFGVGLGYFNCLTEEECREYIEHISAPEAEAERGVRMRSLILEGLEGIEDKDNEEVLIQTLKALFKRIREVEARLEDYEDES